MENWCSKMGFRPDDMNDFLLKFKQQNIYGMKIVWNHVTQHVRPRNEAEVIRKQCLLYTLRTSKLYEKIEAAPLSSLKEYDAYVKFKKDQLTLKNLIEEVERKKAAIKENLSKFETVEKSIAQEEELKEIVFRINHLKKKKVTMMRFIGQLVHDTKMMNVITKQGHTIVNFGSDMSNFQRKVLVAVRKLPNGLEYQSILTHLSTVLEESKFPSVPKWDRTELLISMEEMLMSMNEKLKSCQSAVIKDEVAIKSKMAGIASLTCKKLDNAIGQEDIVQIFEECLQNILLNSKDIATQLSECKLPYKLEVTRCNIRTLQRKIDEKVSNICNFFPIESEEMSSDSFNVPLVVLPSNLPAEKLKNSLSEEISLFMKMPLRDPFPTENYNFAHIQLGCTSRSQFIKLKERLEDHLKLISLYKNIINLVIPPSDSIDRLQLKEKIDKCINGSDETSDLLLNIERTYRRVKASFDFWRKEPLNEKLTGINIEGEDIKNILHSYSNMMEKLNHEEWLRRQDTDWK